MSKLGSFMASKNACESNAEKSMLPATMGSGASGVNEKPKLDASPLVPTRAVDASPVVPTLKVVDASQGESYSTQYQIVQTQTHCAAYCSSNIIVTRLVPTTAAGGWQIGSIGLRSHLIKVV